MVQDPEPLAAPAPPAPRAPPSIRLAEPQPPAAPATAVPEFQMPQPPPPLPELPPIPRPPPRPRPPRPAQPRRTTPPGTQFSEPVELSFGPSTQPARPRQGFNLALNPLRPVPPSSRSPPRRGSDTDISAPDAGPEWNALLRAWWEQHKYYPSQAAERGEDGTVSVTFQVDRDGRVSGLRLSSRSGSTWLDAGALAIFRNAKLPRLPPDTQRDQVDVSVTVHYMLVRR